MNFFFKKRGQEQPKQVNFSSDLPKQGDALPTSLKAHSQFIKRVNCSQCGAPKSLPSATAYIYCDYCGSLMDYDFRMANADTNAGLTNTVFHRIIATVQFSLMQAKTRGDRETYRQIYEQVFTQWLQECPMAASPRAKTDMEFRSQLIDYFAECAVVKDLDPQQDVLQAQMNAYTAALQRISMPNGAWRVAGPFWEYAGMFKKLMETTYRLLAQQGVLAMDPDHAPDAVPLQMEYSTFCQGWLPHLSPEDGERLLKFYGLSAEYDEVKPQPTDKHLCGGCGSEIHSMPNAKQASVKTADSRSMSVARRFPARNAEPCYRFPFLPTM